MKEVLSENDKKILEEICIDHEDILVIQELLEVEKEYELSQRRSGISTRLREKILK